MLINPTGKRKSLCSHNVLEFHNMYIPQQDSGSKKTKINLCTHKGKVIDFVKLVCLFPLILCWPCSLQCAVLWLPSLGACLLRTQQVTAALYYPQGMCGFSLTVGAISGPSFTHWFYRAHLGCLTCSDTPLKPLSLSESWPSALKTLS